MAGVTVFGQGRPPWDDDGVDGQRLLDPGAPTVRRSRPSHILGTLDLDGGRVLTRTHVPR